MCIGLIQLVQDVTLNRFQFGDKNLFKHLLHLIKLRILNRTFNMNGWRQFTANTRMLYDLFFKFKFVFPCVERL